VQLLLYHQCTVDTKDRYSFTPLFAATRNGHEKVVECLLAHGDALVIFNNSLGRTLVRYAAKSGNTQVIEAVLRFAQSGSIQVCNVDLTAKSSPVEVLMESRDGVISAPEIFQIIAPTMFAPHAAVATLISAWHAIRWAPGAEPGLTTWCCVSQRLRHRPRRGPDAVWDPRP
jgi:ankyrin repeat protein